MKMIYCGYQGTGKSTYCREHPLTAIDLDSSRYSPKYQGWEYDYIREANQLANTTKKNIFISAHKEVIEALIKSDIPFEVLTPAENRSAWRRRLEFRYEKNPSEPNMRAIADFEKNFITDMEYYNSLIVRGIIVHKIQARIVTTIENFID